MPHFFAEAPALIPTPKMSTVYCFCCFGGGRYSNYAENERLPRKVTPSEGSIVMLERLESNRLLDFILVRCVVCDILQAWVSAAAAESHVLSCSYVTSLIL